MTAIQRIFYNRDVLNSADQLSRCFRQVVFAQFLLAAVGVLIATVVFDKSHGLALAYGAALALINTLLSKRSIQRASRLAYQQVELSMVPVFTGLIQRLAVFAGGFSAGIMLMGLLPLPILIGFALTQLGYLACKMR